MGTHDIVQTSSRRLESTTCFRIVIPANQSHEFRHGVTVVPRWTEGVLSYQPAGREDDKVCNGCSGVIGGAGENGVDGGIGVVEGNGANGVEAAQVVLVGVVVSVPGDDVEGGVVLAGGEEGVIEFAEEAVFGSLLFVVKGGDGSLEVPSVGETVGANRAEFGELEVALVEFEDVASYWAGGEGDTVSMDLSRYC